MLLLHVVQCLPELLAGAVLLCSYLLFVYLGGSLSLPGVLSPQAVPRELRPARQHLFGQGLAVAMLATFMVHQQLVHALFVQGRSPLLQFVDHVDLMLSANACPAWCLWLQQFSYVAIVLNLLSLSLGMCTCVLCVWRTRSSDLHVPCGCTVLVTLTIV